MFRNVFDVFLMLGAPPKNTCTLSASAHHVCLCLPCLPLLTLSASAHHVCLCSPCLPLLTLSVSPHHVCAHPPCPRTTISSACLCLPCLCLSCLYPFCFSDHLVAYTLSLLLPPVGSLCCLLFVLSALFSDMLPLCLEA
jgi:hypothetical protein